MKLAKRAVLSAVAALGLTAGAAIASEPPWMNSPAKPAATASDEVILLVPSYYGQDDWSNSSTYSAYGIDDDGDGTVDRLLILDQPDLG